MATRVGREARVTPIDLAGGRFGRLLAIAAVQAHPRRRWLCRCDCGVEVLVPTARLRSGHTRSCGCLSRDRTGQRSRGPRPFAERRTLEARFWAKVAKSDGCWVWTGGRKPDGYGTIRAGGERGGGAVVSAHRVSWEMHRGPVPDGLHVLHRCDSPPCVNPAHLFLGSNADNVADKVAKGRQGAPRGSAHPAARLTSEAVREIRASTGSAREVGERHGVSASCVQRIRSGRGWTHVE